MGLSDSLPLPSRCRCPRRALRAVPADRRAHRGDVAQQEVEVVAAPVVKDRQAPQLRYARAERRGVERAADEVAAQ